MADDLVVVLSTTPPLSHSPISLSPSGSDAGEEEDGAGEAHFRPLTFAEVEQSLDKYYYEEEAAASAASGELDILITYLKGQKNLHLQSKIVSETWLNSLLIPTLVITTAITIFAPFIQIYPWSGGFVSGLNATAAFLISLIKYLKLESSVEMFHQTVNQYDKLETSVEFTTSKLLFVCDPVEKSRLVLEKIQDIEKKVSEIKEWNSQLVPSKVMRVFPVICNINIFSFIKRIEGAKRSLVAKLKDVKNEIRYIEHKQQEKYSRRLEHLLEVKDKIKEELMHHRNAYCHIDQLFNREIQLAQAGGGPPLCREQGNPVVERFISNLNQGVVVLT
jgi:hypothetical protein